MVGRACLVQSIWGLDKQLVHTFGSELWHRLSAAELRLLQ